jgi:hypothetical protein
MTLFEEGSRCVRKEVKEGRKEGREGGRKEMK